MPHISQLRESKYLRKEDLERPVIATIAEVWRENVAMQGQAEEHKWILSFHEEDLKPMILNSANIQLTAAATGCDTTEEWPGKKIVLYVDPSIMFAGKICGGIRVRAVRNAAHAPSQPRQPAPAAARPATRPAPAPVTEPEPEQEIDPARDDDSVPF